MQALPAVSRRVFCACTAAFALLTAAIAAAQGGSGQLWVQLFEDRNGNGVLDNEPAITEGASVELLDAQGVVIATAVVDNSPLADRGMVGFRFLPPGAYTIVVTSPDYIPTTETRFPVTLNEGDVLPAVAFGARRETGADSSAGATDLATQALEDLSRRGQIARIAVAALGAVLVVGLMALLGVLIYALVLRRRFRVQAGTRATSTGSVPRVRSTDTGQIQRS
jgi:hypothetical protein